MSRNPASRTDLKRTLVPSVTRRIWSLAVLAAFGEDNEHRPVSGGLPVRSIINRISSAVTVQL